MYIDPPIDLFPADTVVELTAVPVETVTGWIFAGWRGDLTDHANPVSIIMDSNKTITATFIHVKTDGDSNLKSLSLIDPDYIENTPDKPEDLPYGLIEMELSVLVGKTALVMIDLVEPALEQYKWWKLSPTGWIDFTRGAGMEDGAEFDADRKQVTLYLSDNGPHDDDPTVGIIKDPSGLGVTASNNGTSSSSSNGGAGGGCFLATALLSAGTEK